MTKKKKLPQATMEEICVVRDADGNVRPIEVESTLLGRTLVILPMTYGFVRETDDMTKPLMAWPIERKVDLMRQHLVVPDGSTMTLEGVKANMDPMVVDHICALIVMKSSPFSRLHGRANAELVMNALRSAALEAGKTNSER